MFVVVKVSYSQTSFIRTLLIQMIRNPNIFSLEWIFLVLFVLLNPDVLVSESGKARFQQMLFLVYNSDGLIRTPKVSNSVDFFVHKFYMHIWKIKV